MAISAIKQRLLQKLLIRRGINWEPDAATQEAALDAVEAAMRLLRDYAGCKQLPFTRADREDLVVVCAWYLLENKRAEFLEVYQPELIQLRLEAAFGCGKED